MGDSGGVKGRPGIDLRGYGGREPNPFWPPQGTKARRGSKRLK